MPSWPRVTDVPNGVGISKLRIWSIVSLVICLGCSMSYLIRRSKSSSSILTVPS